MILANPRSRTRWLAEYLQCGHDLALGCANVDEFVEKLYGVVGTVETSVALGWPLWRELFPNARFTVIHRTLFDVVDSFTRLSLVPDWMFLYQQDVVLWQLSESDPTSNTTLFSFESLDKPAIRDELCAWIGVPFDAERDAELASKKIEVDVAERKALVEANLENFHAFSNDMGRRLASLAYRPLE